MRAAWFGSVMILALLASGVWGESRSSSSSTRSGRSKASTDDNKDLLWWVDVKGGGATDFDAHQNALEKGLEELRIFLDGQKTTFVWKPNTDYIDTHLVKDRKNGEMDVEDVGKVKKQTLTIGITRRDYREIMNQDRMARSDQRMIFLGKIMAGLVAVFGAFAGYFRLEEATKGFYTAWLRLGAVGLVAAVGAGLYWFR